MECVGCGEHLIVLELERVEVDHCVVCGGVWLDQGEIGLLIGDPKGGERLVSSFEKDTGPGKLRKCPICSKKMEKVLCGTTGKVQIDRCMRSDGLWFDLGELEQIFKSSTFGGHSKVSDWLRNVFVKEN